MYLASNFGEVSPVHPPKELLVSSFCPSHPLFLQHKGRVKVKIAMVILQWLFYRGATKITSLKPTKLPIHSSNRKDQLLYVFNINKSNVRLRKTKKMAPESSLSTTIFQGQCQEFISS